MRRSPFLVISMLGLAVICGSVVARANPEALMEKVAEVPAAQKSVVASGEVVGSLQNPLVVRVHDFPDDWWVVVISSLALIVAICQLFMFRRQLRQMDDANHAAKNAAEAARAALNASNPPHIRVSNPQVWCGSGEPFHRESNVVSLDAAGAFSARVYVVNEGGSPAHVDIDSGTDGNVCVAWLSDRRDEQLPMFRPYKEESKFKVQKFRLKKNIATTASPESQVWVDRDPSEDHHLTLGPGEIARWDLNFSLEGNLGGEVKKTLYLMGAVIYWSFSDGKRSRRRAVGFVYRFDEDRQNFRQVSSDEYPDYVFDE